MEVPWWYSHIFWAYDAVLFARAFAMSLRSAVSSVQCLLISTSQAQLQQAADAVYTRDRCLLVPVSELLA